MMTGIAFSLVLAVAAVGSVPTASARRDQFDLEDLMNKFLTEYDTKNTEPQHVPHQEDIAFEEDQQNYFPDPIEEQSYYSEPQEYYQEPQDHSGFYPEPHHHHHPEHQQHHKHHQHQKQHEQQYKSGYNRYKDVPSKEQQNSPPQPSPSAEQRQPTESGVEESQQPQQEDIDPKLRDFTLIISKLLFQLSQL